MQPGFYAFYQRSLNLFPFSPSVIADATKHAQERWPAESCGVVYNNKYNRMTNVHETPQTAFRMNVLEYAGLFKQFGDPQLVIHSHTQGEHAASKEDMEYQITSGVSCAILMIDPASRALTDYFAWGDAMPVAPWEGRPFIHGVYDCWALYRQLFYADFGIRLKDYARNVDWWLSDRSDDMFMQFFKDCGFSEVPQETMKKGDCLLGRLPFNKKIAHCAYYNGDETLYHHLAGTVASPRLSRKDTLYNVRKYITMVVRHQSQM